jgi:hypothetical protein
LIRSDGLQDPPPDGAIKGALQSVLGGIGEAMESQVVEEGSHHGLSVEGLPLVQHGRNEVDEFVASVSVKVAVAEGGG